MISAAQALADLPTGLRDPLLAEYQSLVQSYMETRWRPSELSGGRFCEIVFTILDGYGRSAFPATPSKPSNFVQACRNLENNAQVPRSFQILIPRMLPALYEVRSNRGVGHVGGDVDPNYMDATVVVAMVNWIMAEMVRVFHSLPVSEAQRVVDLLVERRIPVVWQVGDLRRVLNTSLRLNEQILVLIASSAAPVNTQDLFKWTGCATRSHFNRTLRELHSSRLVELSEDSTTVQILPPGAKRVDQILTKLRLDESR